jgi:endonuclease/exonuclease/phosphatase family metal-dependent hydrolase
MKLVTWNTQWCRGLDGAVSPQRIVEGARAMADFDVLCLQEIAQGYAAHAGRCRRPAGRTAALLPGFQLFFGAAVDEFDAKGQRMRFGNLIATRLPVAQVQHHPLPWPADAGVRSMPRMCTVVTLRSPVLGPVRVMTTHLEYYSKPQRMAQALALRELHIEACAHAAAPPPTTTARFGLALPDQGAHRPHAMLCGDFNLEPPSPSTRRIQQRFGADGAQHLQDSLAHAAMARRRMHRPSACTTARYGPDPVACDFVFRERKPEAPRVRRIEVDGVTQASDHQPVVVEFS